MTLSQEQLDWIVAEVVRRLNGPSTAPAAPMAPQNLQLGERLVTTYTLKGRLADVSQVTVGAKTVVTPAAKDMLNDRGVQLVRSN
jgi:hypothetical protein